VVIPVLAALSTRLQLISTKAACGTIAASMGAAAIDTSLDPINSAPEKLTHKTIEFLQFMIHITRSLPVLDYRPTAFI
jgi:hypothetical protein